MKKLSLLLILLISVVFASCSNYQTAQSFSGVAVDNGYNNFLAGGKLAYFDNALYCVYNTNGGIDNIGMYKITDNATESLFDSDSDSLYDFNVQLYQYNNKLYSFVGDSKNLQVYSEQKKAFKNCNIKVKSSTEYFLSDDLIIYYADNQNIKIKYKNKKEYTLNFDADRFYPVDNMLYIQNDKGWLYGYNLDTPKKEPEFIDYLADERQGNIFSVCGGYVYYDYSGDSLDERTDGLYRYSLKNKKSELVTDSDVSCVNFYNGEFYFVADNRAYLNKYDEAPKKLTDIKVDEIYILDENLIYLYDNNGNIYRITTDGNTVEKIEIKQ